MQIEPGTHTLGPNNAKLLIRTGRTGGAAKAGHDLVLEVTSWTATVEAGAEPSDLQMSLSADSRSLRVLEGTGGLKPLVDKDRDSIRKTIDDDVLKGCSIEFSSTRVTPAEGGDLRVEGQLDLFGKTSPVSFDLHAGGGQVIGTATVKHTDFGVKPYSALFGALKVADEVRVEIDAPLPVA